jgi:hypothetical protein
VKLVADRAANSAATASRYLMPRRIHMSSAHHASLFIISWHFQAAAERVVRLSRAHILTEFVHFKRPMDWARDDAGLSEEDLENVFMYEPKPTTVIKMVESTGVS